MTQKTGLAQLAATLLQKRQEGSWLFNKKTYLALLGGLALFDTTAPIASSIQNGVQPILDSISSFWGMAGGGAFFACLLAARRVFGGNPGFIANLLKAAALVAIYLALAKYMDIPVSRGLVLAILVLSFIPLKSILSLIVVAGCFMLVYTLALASDTLTYPELKKRFAALPIWGKNGSDSPSPAASLFVDPAMKFDVKEITLGGKRVKFPIPQTSNREMRIAYREPTYYSDGSCGIPIYVGDNAYYFVILKWGGNAGPATTPANPDTLSGMAQREFGAATPNASADALLRSLEIAHGGRLSTATEQRSASSLLLRTRASDCKRNNTAVDATIYHGIVALPDSSILIRSASVSMPTAKAASGNDDSMRRIVNSWFGFFATINTAR